MKSQLSLYLRCLVNELCKRTASGKKFIHVLLLDFWVTDKSRLEALFTVCVCVCFHPDYPSLLIPLHHSLKPSGLLFDHTDITHVLRTEFVSFKCCVFTLKYPPFLFSWSSDDFESRHVQLFFLSCMKSSSLVSSSGL